MSSFHLDNCQWWWGFFWCQAWFKVGFQDQHSTWNLPVVLCWRCSNISASLGSGACSSNVRLFSGEKYFPGPQAIPHNVS
jgi:hypothetical protein